jgi:hypothetical protein
VHIPPRNVYNNTSIPMLIFSKKNINFSVPGNKYRKAQSHIKLTLLLQTKNMYISTLLIICLEHKC